LTLLGCDARDSITPAKHLGDVSRCRGRLGESEEYYRAALELRKKTLGAAHANVADTEAALGRLLTERRAYEEAEQLLRHALEVRRQSKPATHWRIGYTQTILGNCLRGERRNIAVKPDHAWQSDSRPPGLRRWGPSRSALTTAAPYTMLLYA